MLIEIGQRIGTLPTVAIIVVTGILGATLAHQQGLSVLGQLQSEMAEGRMPAVRGWIRGKLVARIRRAVAEGRGEFIVYRRGNLPWRG